MSNSSLILLAVIGLAGCTPTEREMSTQPTEQPQYPTPVTIHTPTPPSASGWVRIQEQCWNRAEVRPEKVHYVEALSTSIQRNKARYTTVQDACNGVPWQVIGSIHNMECSQNFRQHLHNGDTITAKTRHVPAGRPNPWFPPTDWESSAIDAVRYDKLDRKDWRGIGNELQNVESFNGLGYQRYHPDTPSPYLWAGTTIEKPGKYLADGVYSDTAISNQIGVVPLLKTLK